MGFKMTGGGENPPRPKNKTEEEPRPSMDRIVESLGVNHAVEVLTKALVNGVSYSKFIETINDLNAEGERVTQREISAAIERSNKPLPADYVPVSELQDLVESIKPDIDRIAEDRKREAEDLFE